MSERLQALSGGGGGRRKPGWLDGRTRRRQYWLLVTPAMIVGVTLSALQVPGASLIMGIPILLIWIRRLHDLGYSGWSAPFINVGTNILAFAGRLILGAETGGIIALLVYLGVIITLGAIPGQPRTNKFGPPPGKTVVADALS